MTDLSDLKAGFSKLGLGKSLVNAHASLKAFGHIEGGAETMVDALLDSVRGIIMPTFTYLTMLNPEVGPPHNGITYGSETNLNKMAVAYHPDLPVDKMMGVLPEVLRKHPKAKRSMHPIQSFAGVRADVYRRGFERRSGADGRRGRRSQGRDERRNRRSRKDRHRRR